MTFSRTALLKITGTLRLFDSSPLPYIGLQWGETTPLFHRATMIGQIESVGYRREPPALIVSLPHLRDSLNNLQDDEIDLAADKGILVLSSSKGYVTELRVHTIRPDVTWTKTHLIGQPTEYLQADGFKGIKTDPFGLKIQPTLRDNKLMLTTDYGVIIRDEVPVKGYPYPCDVFLRTIASLNVEKLYMTDMGYWGALASGFTVSMMGHRAGDTLFDLYSGPAAPLAEFPAVRLTQSLTAAANLAGERTRVTMDPTAGIIVQDKYGEDNRYAIGEVKGWSRFSILPLTAQILADAFAQSKHETIVLGQISPDTLRLTRGQWQVSFKAIFPK